MRAIKPFLSAGEKLVDRVLCVIGAVTFSQAPEFMQQYLQRLGGHLAEARHQLAQYEDLARKAGKSVEELATQYSANTDPSVAGIGHVVSDTLHRVEALASAEASLRDASVWTRPFVFLRDLDSEVARGTARVFSPAVPTTVEGLLYAALGIVVVMGLYHGLLVPFLGRLFRRRPAKVQIA